MSTNTIDSLRTWLNKQDFSQSLGALDDLDDSDLQKLTQYLTKYGLSDFQDQDNNYILAVLSGKTPNSVSLPHKTN